MSVYFFVITVRRLRMSNDFNRRIESARLCGEILSKCRAKADFSRREMSQKIGFSESTIKAWENGDGSPTLSVMLDWFNVTGCNMFRSMLDFLWTDTFASLNAKSSESDLRKAISLYINEVASDLEVKRLHQIIFHGAREDWGDLLKLFCAYAHLTLLKRHHVVEINRTAYEICAANNTTEMATISEPEHVLVKGAIRSAKASILNRNRGYMVGFYEKSVTDVTTSMLKNSRMDRGVSQGDMSKALGKSERTIQNWETSIQPTVLEINCWFDVLGENMWFYLRNALNPYEPIKNSEDSKSLRNELIRQFNTATLHEIRMLAYLIFGEYGSYWNAVIEMMYEHINLPLNMRVLVVRTIVTGYEADINDATLQCGDHILPKLSDLESYVNRLVNAAKSGENQ